jgi:two-component system chemotaxis response regulator CheB
MPNGRGIFTAPMTKPKQLIIIAGSAGSLQVILTIVSQLRNDLSVPILIVVHRKASSTSLLKDILISKTKLAVKEIEDKEIIKAGTIYIAPADYHTLIETEEMFALDYSEKVHFTRPSIDVSLQSAAEVYGENLYVFILSGANADGAEGLADVIQNDGKGWAQDPSTAEVSVMPEAALEIANVQSISPDKIAGVINEL